MGSVEEEYTESIMLLPYDCGGMCLACNTNPEATIIFGADTNQRQLINICFECAEILRDKLSSLVEEGLTDVDFNEEETDDTIPLETMDPIASGFEESIPFEFDETPGDGEDDPAFIGGPDSIDTEEVEDDGDPTTALPSVDVTKPIEC